MNKATPRAPARAQLPLLPLGPGGLAKVTPHEESPQILRQISPDYTRASIQAVRSAQLVLWEAEVDAAVARVKPTRSNNLGLGKESKALFAVSPGVAK